MIIESGTIYRSIASQKDFSFYFDIINSTVTGQSVVGISGSGNKVDLFYFSGGKIIDNNQRYIWSYNPREIINISGNINNGYLNYFINNTPVCVFTPIKNFYYDHFYFSTKNSIFDIDFFIKGQVPDYNFNFPLTVNLNQNITGLLYNNSSPKDITFKIFTGDIFVTNFDYFLNNFPKNLISGRSSGQIVLQPNFENTRTITETTEAQLTLIFQTNFGEITKNFTINVIPEPVYFTQFITGFTGVLGFLSDRTLSKAYNYELRSLYPVNRNFTLTLENISGHTGKVILDEFFVTGNATGKLSGFIHGFDYITGRVLGTGISSIRDYFGNQITGQIDVNYRALRYATGNINYFYNLPLLGSGTGRSPAGTIIPASGVINANNLSGFVFGQGLFSTPNIINLEGYYFNTLNTGQGLFEIPDFNVSYTGPWDINYEDYFWKSSEVTGVGYSGVGNLIYPVRGFLNGDILNSNTNGRALINSTLYAFQHTGNLLSSNIQISNNFFIKGSAFASENNNLSNNAFIGNNYFYITGQSGFIGFNYANYQPSEKGKILYYSFDVDFNSLKQPYIFKLQMSTSPDPFTALTWLDVDIVTGANFYTSSPKIFTCKFPNNFVNDNPLYNNIRILVQSGINWLHKFSGNRSSSGMGIRNLKFYNAQRVSAIGDGNLIRRDLIPNNITNYNFNGTPIPTKSLSGYVLNSQDIPSNPAWYAFNTNKTLYPYTELVDNESDPIFLGYAFSGNGVKFSGYSIEFENNFLPPILRVEGSNNNQNYTVLAQRNIFPGLNNITGSIGFPQNQNTYKYVRFKFKDAAVCSAIPPENVDINSPCYLQTIANDEFCCNGGWDSDCELFYNTCISAGSSSSTTTSSSSTTTLCIDGKFQTAVNQWGGPGIYVSNDYGQTWVPRENAGPWQSVAMSADGQIQTAARYESQIYVSTNAGFSWLGRGPILSYLSVAMTSNGQYQILGTLGDKLYITNNYGNDWYPLLVNRTWVDVDISDNGYISAVANGDEIYTSTDFGLTWTNKLSALSWKGISLSRDGRYQTAVAQNSQIYISHNFGQTWSGKESVRDWTRVAINGDGSKQTAIAYFDKIYTSFNYGLNWSPKDSNRGWVDVSLSYFGDYQTALGDNINIYVSESAGGVFVPKEEIRTWRGIAVNKFPCGLTFSSSSSSLVIWPPIESSSTTSDSSSSSSNINNLSNYFLWLDANDLGTVITSSSTSILSSSTTQSSSSSTSSSTTSSSSSSALLSLNSWRAASMSVGGKYQSVIANRGLLYTSSNFGQTWTTRFNDVNRNWTDIFVSSGGKYQIAVEGSGYMYLSTDFGQSWAQRFINESKQWESAVVSHDAKIQVALADNYNIYISQNSGRNWSLTNIKPESQQSNLLWGNVAISDNGQYISAVTTNEFIYNSLNSGNTWLTGFSSNKSWRSTSISENGKYQIVTEYNGNLWLSDNSGTQGSWVAKFTDENRSWRSAVLNSNGSIQAAVIQNGPIYISYDTGLNWNIINLIKDWKDITISDNGRYQIAVASDNVYFSTNSGISWEVRQNLTHQPPITPDFGQPTILRQNAVLDFELLSVN